MTARLHCLSGVREVLWRPGAAGVLSRRAAVWGVYSSISMTEMVWGLSYSLPAIARSILET